MLNEKSFYLTTTLPYVNADLHMGHALEFVRADIIARYKKLRGYDVFFNTGTDEHGMKICEKAREAGESPQDFVDRSFLRFRESVKIFGMHPDLHFIRTTSREHRRAAVEFWKRVYTNGFIYKKNYRAKYCVGCEETKSDSELVGGVCPVHPGRKLEILEEENYFFKYSEFGGKLLQFYESRPDFVVPDFRYKEIKAFVSRGLQDFSISRLKSKMPWGIEVPGDSDHVMYVWFDALTSYIATLGWPDDAETFEKYWVEGTPTQYCGKDNLRFQSAMWQAMLMAADLPNSHQIVINGFITAAEGLKMSKTLGNVVDPTEVVKEYGTDALRFFLAKEISNFEDSPFTMERFKAAYNAGLANGLGNLVSRVMTMAVSNNIKIPLTHLKPLYSSEESVEIKNYIEKYDIKGAMDSIWKKISEADLLIQTNKPFSTIKTDETRARLDIQTLLRWLLEISHELKAFLPNTSKTIEDLVRQNKKPEAPLFLHKD